MPVDLVVRVPRKLVNALLLSVLVCLLVINIVMGRKNHKSRKPQRAKRHETNNLKSRNDDEYDKQRNHPSKRFASNDGSSYQQLAVRSYDVDYYE